MPIIREVDFFPDGRRMLESLPLEAQEVLLELLGSRVCEDHPVGPHLERLMVNGRVWTVVAMLDPSDPNGDGRSVYWVPGQD